MNTIRENIEYALTQIRERGWTQAEPISDDGKCCIIGAVALNRWPQTKIRLHSELAYSETETLKFLAKLLIEQGVKSSDELPVEDEGGVLASSVLWHWNDDERRTQEEVEAFLELALIELDD